MASSYGRPDDINQHYLTSLSLDMVVPLGTSQENTGLLARWDDLSVEDLPHNVRDCSLRERSKITDILEALLMPEAIDYGCDLLVHDLKTVATTHLRSRSTSVSLARMGLLSEELPTLEELGTKLDISRERVRQLEKTLEYCARRVISWKSPLALTLGAWFALNPRQPLTERDIEELAKSKRRARCIRLTLQALNYPHLVWNGVLWTSNEREIRAAEVLLTQGLLRVGLRSRGWNEIAAAIVKELPGIDRVLDLERTLQRVCLATDIGPGLDGRLVRGVSGEMRRVARKIATFLAVRAFPISYSEMADVISSGHPPFEVFEKPQVNPVWVRTCVRTLPESLRTNAEGVISLAPNLAKNPPPGRVGILYSLMVDHGEPMRMQDLCDRAATAGMSRNQVAMLIHSRRAACLFMLKRGIVGLVGRDEDANPDEYVAATPAAGGSRVRPGHGVGVDEEGAVLADLKVRRSIREQELSLPWPFSLVLLDNNSSLMIDGEPAPMVVRNNLALKVNQLEPNSTVQLRMLPSPTKGTGISLEIFHNGRCPMPPQLLESQVPGGKDYPVGRPIKKGRPGWLYLFQEQYASETFASSYDLIQSFPSALSRRRKLYLFHGLAALGFIRMNKRGWATDLNQPLPFELQKALKTVSLDPGAYPARPDRERAAIVWLVKAAWLTANLGWSVVQVNDLTTEFDLPESNMSSTVALTTPRKAALMRVSETAHQAEDHVLHPSNLTGIEETLAFARRYLIALGFTTYGAIREIESAGGAIVEYRTNGQHPAGVWVLKPLGTEIQNVDVERARAEAKAIGVDAWAVCNGVQLEGEVGFNHVAFRIDDVASNNESFEHMLLFAADPRHFE